MLELLVWLAVLVIVVLVAWWLMQQLSLPEPVQRIVTIVLVVVVAIIAIGVLLNLTGMGPGFFRLPRGA